MDSVPNVGASPDLYSLPSFPPQPSDVNHPAVSYSYEPVRGGMYSSPKTNQANPTTGVSSVASWNSAPSWDPVEDSELTYTVSEPLQPLTEVGAPPSFVAGELETYLEKLETGDSEVETEELSYGPPPPPPPPPPAPYPEPVYQGGELSNYESIFEHGNEERETEDQGFLPPYAAPPEAYELPVASPEESAPGEFDRSVSQGFRPNLYHLFMTGQLPPGMLSHFQSDYETGGDHWGEVHYERYYYPEAEQPAVPAQTQVVPSGKL